MKEIITKAINREINKEGMSVRLLSQETGIPKVSIYRIMAGSNLSLNTLEKLIRALDLKFSIRLKNGNIFYYSKINLLAPYNAIRNEYFSLEFSRVTNRELAKMANITSPTLLKILRNGNTTIKVMCRLFEVFGITIINN